MDGSMVVLFVTVLCLLVLPQPLEDFALAKHEKRPWTFSAAHHLRPWNVWLTVLAVSSAVGFYLSGVLTPLWAVVLVVLWTLVRTDLKARILPDFLVISSIFGVMVWQLVTGVTPAELLSRFMLPGVLMVITLYGNWALRKGSEARHPEYPMGYMQVGAATVVGFFNLWAALLVFAGLVVANLIRKSVVRIPDFVVLPLLLLLYVYTLVEPGTLHTEQAFQAAGLTTLICAIYWWSTPEIDDNTPYDPISFGFGDTKLMGLLALLLPVNRGFDVLILAVLIGIVLGLVYRLITREKQVPFGPALVLAFVLCGAFPHLFRWIQAF